MTEPVAVRPTVRDWLSLIRFSHSVFALPFAGIALLVATAGRPSVELLLLVTVAMVAARSAAMAYNRWADRDIDALNPRTRVREIPSGKLAAHHVLWFAILCAAAFVGACAALGPACLWMAPPVLLVLLGYSHAKRFTALAHVWLGLALGLAPPAAWVAARGEFDADLWTAAALGGAVTAWVSGFDIVYALQDEHFDRSHGLHSLPARLGARRALLVARACHGLAVLGFTWFGLEAGLGVAWFVGVAAAALLLAWQHRIVAPDELGRIDLAFFTLNGLVGVLLFAAAGVDLWAFGAAGQPG